MPRKAATGGQIILPKKPCLYMFYIRQLLSGAHSDIARLPSRCACASSACCVRPFVMELYEGGSLAAVRARPGRLSALGVLRSKSLFYGAFGRPGRLRAKNGGIRPVQMLEAKGGKGPPLPQALRYGVQVTWGLASLHDQNVAVLDLKPDNLLFDEHDLHYSPLSRNQAGV